MRGRDPHRTLEFAAHQWMCLGQCEGRKGPRALLFMKMKYL